ncbi:MAG: ABC transporter permease [Gemmatimonadaceae bacterium]|nr:ABC transporter permease [Gemmatimonadaceae bacterium]
MLVVVVAASAAFGLLHLAPGDPVSGIADMSNVSAELRAQWRAQGGYDQPIAVQYARWMADVARGRLGRSTSQQRPVIDVIGDRLPNTLLLMSLALAASVLLGTALGAWQGARAGSRRDRALTFASLLLYSIPEFWLALALLYVFAFRAHVLPATGMIDAAMYDSMTPWQQMVDRARHLVLPWLSLTLIGTAIFARYQRSTMRDVLRESFVRTARAKGLSESAVRRQARRAAILPVVTLSGLFFPALLTGAVFVERVYGWPGMGSALLKAVGDRDYALVSACVIVGSAMTALGSLLADVVRVILDPRLRGS